MSTKEITDRFQNYLLHNTPNTAFKVELVVLCLGGLEVTPNSQFSLSKCTKQLLFVTFCCAPAGIEAGFLADAGPMETEGQTKVKIEIVM